MRKVESLYTESLNDREVFRSESPVVSGQALTGAELHRRVSSGLPVGCNVRTFNEINPYLDKFQVYDAISSFQVRHGMLPGVETSDNTVADDQSPSEQTNVK